MQLQPYQNSLEKAECSVFGDIFYHSNSLVFTFDVHEQGAVLIKDLHPSAEHTLQWQRKSELWRTTCLEAFWSEPKSKSYWELNLSPLGYWNLYHFDDYRKPDFPQECFDFELVSVTRSENQFKNQFKVQLSHNLTASQIEASLCSVIRLESDTVLYFASTHLADKPDFHLRKSFTLKRIRI
jgi:hypothetical protein